MKIQNPVRRRARIIRFREVLAVAFILAIMVGSDSLWAEGAEASRTTISAPPVVAYYFHGTRRCPTCRKLEAYSREAIQKNFAKELGQGSLQWQVVNIDEPGNKHFIKDFDLFASSLVLVRTRKGQATRVKNLEQIWQLVGRPEAFSKYVQEEVRSFLRGS